MKKIYTTEISLDKREITIPFELLPLSNSMKYIILTGSKTDEKKLKDKSKRKFELRLLLSKDQMFNSKDLEIEPQLGGSFFLLPKNKKKIIINSTKGSFTLHKNERHELSMITANINIFSFEEAFSLFFQMVSPFLDQLSFTFNIPIIIYRIGCKDLKNDLYIYNWVVPYTTTHFSKPNNNAPEELIPILALFREAKNNSSNFYKFLCYYKILEGIFRHIRPKLFKDAKEKAISIEVKKEKVEDYEFLSSEQKPYIGKSIKSVFENYLTNQYRNTVAHYFSNHGIILNVSDYYSNFEFNNVLLLTELCVIKVIENQLDYFEQLKNNNI